MTTRSDEIPSVPGINDDTSLLGQEGGVDGGNRLVEGVGSVDLEPDNNGSGYGECLPDRFHRVVKGYVPKYMSQRDFIIMCLTGLAVITSGCLPQSEDIKRY